MSIFMTRQTPVFTKTDSFFSLILNCSLCIYLFIYFKLFFMYLFIYLILNYCLCIYLFIYFFDILPSQSQSTNFSRTTMEIKQLEYFSCVILATNGFQTLQQHYFNLLFLQICFYFHVNQLKIVIFKNWNLENCIISISGK